MTFLRGDILLKPPHKDFPRFQTCLDNFQAVSDSQRPKIQTTECRSWLIKTSLLQWIIYTERDWKSGLLPLHCHVQIAISAVIKPEEKRGLYDKRILLSWHFEQKRRHDFNFLLILFQQNFCHLSRLVMSDQFFPFSDNVRLCLAPALLPALSATTVLGDFVSSGSSDTFVPLKAEVSN